MAKNQNHIVTVLDEEIYYTLQELCIIQNINQSTIIEFIEYGIIEPDRNHEPPQHFSYKQLQRLQLALKLMRDLEIDISGLSLSLDLLEEVQQLRREVKILQQLLQQTL